MRGLREQNQTDKFKNRCSYCRSTSHRIVKCPHVSVIWRELTCGSIPLNYLSKYAWEDEHTYSYYNPFREWTTGSNWGNLYEATRKAYQKQLDYQNRQKQKLEDQESGVKKKRKPVTCGFCGDEGHTRRTCVVVEEFEILLKEANNNFRTWFHKEHVLSQGLSTGAIIEFEAVQHYGYARNHLKISKTIRSLVTQVNWDEINLFAALDKLNFPYSTGAPIGISQARYRAMCSFLCSNVFLKVSSQDFLKKEEEGVFDLAPNRWDNNSIPSSLYVPLILSCDKTTTEKRLHRKDEKTNRYLPHKDYGAINLGKVKVISDGPHTPSSDWTSEYADKMCVIFKKFTYEELDSIGALHHIKYWANKEV